MIRNQFREKESKLGKWKWQICEIILWVLKIVHLTLK